MKLDRRGIPAKVLNGKVPKYRSVSTIYRARMAQQVMLRINRSFWARAKRGSDDLGNTWLPLSPKTHAYKPLSPIEKNTYDISGKENRGLLTPAQDRLWRGIFARTYKRLIAKGEGDKEAKKKAAEKAWSILKARGARTYIGLGRITDTNIRTGVLVAATKPGTVANNRYYPPKNQVVTINPRSIKVRFNIPYIKKVDAVRPVVPDNIDKWVQEAHEVAIIEAKQTYERIKSDTPDRKRRSSGKSSNRSKRKRN